MRRCMPLMRSTDFLPPGVAFILLGVVALLTLAAASAPRPGARGSGRRRRLRGAAPGRVRPSRIIGRSISTSRSSPPPPLRWRARGCGRGSPSPRSCSARCGRCPGADAIPVEALGAHVFNALAGFALGRDLLVCGLLYGPRGAPGEVDRLSTLALSVYLLVAALPRAGEPARPARAHGLRHPHRRDRRHRLAHGGSDRRRAGRRDPRHRR